MTSKKWTWNHLCIKQKCACIDPPAPPDNKDDYYNLGNLSNKVFTCNPQAAESRKRNDISFPVQTCELSRTW